jgi:hypothetical protein
MLYEGLRVLEQPAQVNHREERGCNREDRENRPVAARIASGGQGRDDNRDRDRAGQRPR